MLSRSKVLDGHPRRVLAARRVFAPELAMTPPIGMHRGTADARRPFPLADHSHTGTVTIQTGHCGTTLGIVEAGRVHFRADHQHPLVGAGRDELVGDAETEHEAGALRPYVERTDGAAAHLILKKAAGPRKVGV